MAQTAPADSCVMTGTVFHSSFANVYGASPLLPPEHWAVRAAERLHAVGFAPSYLPAQGAVPRAEVLAALLEGGEAVIQFCQEPHLAPWEPVVEGWLDRFLEEFPESYGPAGPVVHLGTSVGAGYAERTGVLAPAVGYRYDRQNPLPAEGDAGLVLHGSTGVLLGRTIFAAGELTSRSGATGAARWEVGAGARGWQLSAGQAEVRYGPGRGGGIVLSPRDPLPRVEVRRTRPLRFPGVLGYAGRVTGHLFVSRMTDEDRHSTEPWMFGARLAVQPHGRLALGLNRGAVFGGEGRPLTFRNVAGLAAGAIRSHFENQILSFDARWRLPTDALLPVTVYAEWGADDGAGALNEMPGYLGGLFIPALPGVPQVALGVEGARFTDCCGHSTWYFNATFPGNWARGDQALGHPLGGEGWERSAYASADLLDSRVRLRAQGFQRERRQTTLGEMGGGNLFSPWRTGRSDGWRVDGEVTLMHGAELRGSWVRDAGGGWEEQVLRLGLFAYF